MITHETVVWAGDYEIKMTVYDDTEWLVSINNSVLEVGTTSGPCRTNWNKGLAECILSITELLNDGEENLKFIQALQNCGFIRFNDVLKEMAKLVDPDPFEIDEKTLDAMEAEWENSWIDGPQW